jgi:hypothetical protein
MAMKNTDHEVIGVTQIINKLPATSYFSQDDELLLNAFSALGAVTIEKSRLFNTMQNRLDEVTGIKNRLNLVLGSTKHIIMSLDKEGRLVRLYLI